MTIWNRSIESREPTTRIIRRSSCHYENKEQQKELHAKYNNNLLIDSHKKWQVKKKLDRGEPRKGMVVPRVKLDAIGPLHGMFASRCASHSTNSVVWHWRVVRGATRRVGFTTKPHAAIVTLRLSEETPIARLTSQRCKASHVGGPPCPWLLGAPSSPPRNVVFGRRKRWCMPPPPLLAWSVDVQCDTCQLNIVSGLPKRAWTKSRSTHTVALTEFASKSLLVKVHLMKKSGGRKTRR
jgi:hypothetical protein